jgi:predicted MFS family arabinose efflux permease
MTTVDKSTQEKFAIFVIAAVQFVNIVDFMMVMPLGPDFAKALGIRVSHMGVLAGAYTLAASVSGLLGTVFLDRIPRRKALVWSILGLSLGTAAGALAWDFHSLLWARVFAGIFGGPTTSIGLAIISDLVPHERRGAALGKVMIGFSLASIFGVPIGLEVARVAGWSAPFIMVGLMALITAVLARFALPELNAHVTSKQGFISHLPIKTMLKQKTVWNSYSLLFCVMMSGFLIFPNIAGYVQFNLDFPREEMGQLYFVGGIASLLVMTFCGRLVDLWGSLPWFILGSIGFFGALWFGMYQQPPLINPYGLFVAFMVFGTFRNISMQTLSSKVPRREERAGFMSLQSAVQHAAMAAGGILSSRLLETAPDGKLLGVEKIAGFSSVLVVVAVLLIVSLARQVRYREN